MWARTSYQTIFGAVAMVVASSATYGLTLEEVTVSLERAGYSQIREIKSGKITTFRAVKNGKVVSLIFDSSGHFKEFP
jgi:hypothetical protein